VLVKEANKITGGLSNPSKMPGRSYNLPAQECNIGSKLVKIAGTVCESCYALKGRYLFPNVKAALYRRLASLKNPLWARAMAALITKQSPDYFRWHDSGDIMGMAHLYSILVVCAWTPETKHWMPTKEGGLINKLVCPIPKNLTIRLSAPFVDRPVGNTAFLGSVVYTKANRPDGVFFCPAHQQDNQCKKCRVCWGKDEAIVVYPKH